MSNLFRKEALQGRSNRLFGDVLLLPTINQNLTIFLYIFWFICIIFILAQTNYSKKQRVVGWIEPVEGLIKIRSDYDGVIEKIYVSNGQYVEKGQPLFKLSSAQYMGDGKKLNVDIKNEIQHQLKMIEQDIQKLKSDYVIKEKDVEVKKVMLKNKIELIEEQLQQLKTIYEIKLKQLDRSLGLRVKGFVSANDIDDMNAQLGNLNVEILNLRKEKLSTLDLLNELNSDSKLNPGILAAEINSLLENSSELNQKMSAINQDSARLIKAPKGGYVNNIQVFEGQIISATNRDLLVAIFPNGRFKASLLLPVKSIGVIELGQHVKIKYDAYPYQKFGIYSAKVDKISNIILLPEELSSSSIKIEEPMYKIEASLLEDNVSLSHKKYEIKPGMTLRADIEQDRRTVLQWILHPFYGMKGSF